MSQSKARCDCSYHQRSEVARRNEGAESTLAFLLSLAEMRLARNMLASFKQPIDVEE